MTNLSRSLHQEAKCGKSGKSSKQIPGIRRTPAQGYHEKSIQRSVTLDRVRPGGGLSASTETERRSQTEDGGAPGGQRGKRPASGGWSGETQTIGKAAVRVQVGSAKSDARITGIAFGPNRRLEAGLGQVPRRRRRRRDGRHQRRSEGRPGRHDCQDDGRTGDEEEDP